MGVRPAASDLTFGIKNTDGAREYWQTGTVVSVQGWPDRSGRCTSAAWEDFLQDKSQHRSQLRSQLRSQASHPALHCMAGSQ